MRLDWFRLVLHYYAGDWINIRHPNSPIMQFDTSLSQSAAHLKCPINSRRSKMSMKIAILSKNIRFRLQSSYTVSASFKTIVSEVVLYISSANLLWSSF